jgi:hypothetical protein
MLKLSIGALTLLLLGGLVSARTTIKAGTITIDGQTVRQLACEVEKGGLFATMAVVGTIRKQKKVLDACAPRGAAFRMKWTWPEGKSASAVEVVLASDPGLAACVVKAIQLTRGDVVVGECQATVLVGDAAGAAKAADALAAPAPAAAK